MGSILQPGYLRWDGLKFVLDPTVEIVGPPGSPGAQGPEGPTGLSGNAALVFRPGGTASGNVYISWTTVMAARASIQGPAVIAVDDSLSSASVDPGTWDLTGNTSVIGNTYQFSPAFGNTALTIPNNAQLLNPFSFRDISIVADTSSEPAITFGNSFTTLNLDCYNTSWINSGKTKPIIDASAAATITLGGASTFVSGPILGGTLSSSTVLNINGSSSVGGNTLYVNGGGSFNLEIHISGVTASCNSTQTHASGGTIIFDSPNTSGSFSSTTVGNVLTVIGNATADWVAPQPITAYVPLLHTHQDGYFHTSSASAVPVVILNAWGLSSTVSGYPATIGSLTVNIILEVVLSLSGAATCIIELYDITNAVAITGSIINTNGLSNPTTFQVVNAPTGITLGSATGNINSSGNYQLQAQSNGSATLSIQSAWLKITYT